MNKGTDKKTIELYNSISYKRAQSYTFLMAYLKGILLEYLNTYKNPNERSGKYKYSLPS